MHKLLFSLLLLGSCFSNRPPAAPPSTDSMPATTSPVSRTAIVQPTYDNGALIKINKSDTEWKGSLSAEQYHVLREEGTERAFTGHLWNQHDKGLYVCAGCKLPLFSSTTKFDSGTGWPSFYQPLTKDCIREVTDDSYGMRRIETVCNVCQAHLGHVFPDGPPPSGLRYCMNALALKKIDEH